MITALLATMLAGDGVQLKFIAEGAVARAGGYSPIRANFAPEKPKSVKKAPADLKNPAYGTMQFGAKGINFIIDDIEASRLFVDSNGDGDYTNDAAPEWTGTKRGEFTMFQGGTKADISKGLPVKINFYRFDPKDPSRAALKNVILFYADFGYEVSLTLGDKSYTAFIAGEPGANTSIGVDRNGDGKKSYNFETIRVGKPFNYTGTTYVLNFKDGSFQLDKAAEALETAPLPPNLAVGQKALPFTMKALDGGEIKFPETYKGKIVMIDFWATWCGPCIAELPNLTKAYEQFHDKGFEVLGVSFDQENMAEKVKDFTKEKNMAWRHLYEGKYWNTTIGMQYDVSGIPFCLLVDGDTGEILAGVNKLRGEAIFGTIEAALAKKKSGR